MASAVQRATMGICMAVALEDGDFAKEEFLVIARVVSDHPIFEGLSDDDLRRLRESVLGDLEPGDLLSSVARFTQDIPPAMGLQVFKLALDVMYADGVVDDDEGMLVVRLARLLGITDADFSSAVDRAKRRSLY